MIDGTCSQIWVGISAKYPGKFYTNIQILISAGTHLRWRDNTVGQCEGLDNHMIGGNDQAGQANCLVMRDEMGLCLIETIYLCLVVKVFHWFRSF